MLRLLWRQRYTDGRLSPWRETTGPQVTPWKGLWNPTKRVRKGVTDATSERAAPRRQLPAQPADRHLGAVPADRQPHLRAARAPDGECPAVHDRLHRPIERRSARASPACSSCRTGTSSSQRMRCRPPLSQTRSPSNRRRPPPERSAWTPFTVAGLAAAICAIGVADRLGRARCHTHAAGVGRLLRLAGAAHRTAIVRSPPVGTAVRPDLRLPAGARASHRAARLRRRAAQPPDRRRSAGAWAPSRQGTVLVARMLLYARNQYGQDGSDQMMLVVMMGVTIALAANDRAGGVDRDGLRRRSAAALVRGRRHGKGDLADLA